MPAITALPSLSDDRLQPVVAPVEMQNLVHADHAVVVTNDPELDLNTHAHPNGCRCCSGQPIRRRRRELPQISQALTCSHGCELPSLETGIQAIQLLPYRAGLARRQVWHVRSSHAFQPCCSPIRLSPSGKVDDPEAPLSASPACSRDSTRRFARRTFSISSGFPVPLDGRIASGSCHCGYLRIHPSSTCGPSPCGRLSRPRTTTAAPSP